MSGTKHYNTTMVILHWLLAIFILGAIFMGAFVLDGMDSIHPQKIALLETHMIVGIGILLLTLLRLVVRFKTPQPAPVAGGSKWMNLIATGVHYLLYFLTIVTALAGMTLALSAKLNEIVFQHIGTLPKDFEGYVAHEIHGVFAELLLLTILLHIAAALYHQFILKDGLMSRMSLRKD
jgi:cytochrome b561